MAKREKIFLTTEQADRLRGLTDDIEWLKEEIRRAELVGIDITDLKERFEKTTTIRNRMLEEYVK
jgi:hypothetical protein